MGLDRLNHSLGRKDGPILVNIFPFAEPANRIDSQSVQVLVDDCESVFTIRGEGNVGMGHSQHLLENHLVSVTPQVGAFETGDTCLD